VLARLSRHYQRPAECLPLLLMERLRAGKHLLAGSYRSGYLASALFDLDVYSDPHVDVTRLDALYRARYEEVTGFRQDERAHFPACWCVVI
jgi:Zn-dependent oligopeptidase